LPIANCQLIMYHYEKSSISFKRFIMQLYQYPNRSEWKALLQRPVMNNEALEGSVKNILQEVKQKGDAAVKKFTQQFDKATISNLVVSEEELMNAQQSLDAKLKAAILSAKVNIETFHRSQLTAPEVIETMPGVQCWRKNVAIEKVGLLPYSCWAFLQNWRVVKRSSYARHPMQTDN
jgi:histidinol dehydrogenase